MNLLTGIVIIAILFAGANSFYVDQMSGFGEGFPLEGENGLMVGDVFYRVDGWRTYIRGDAAMFLSFNDGQGIDIEVIRNGKLIVLEDLTLYRRTYGERQNSFGLQVGGEASSSRFFDEFAFHQLSDLDFVQ